jgi:hypothetical protein
LKYYLKSDKLEENRIKVKIGEMAEWSIALDC